MSSRLLDIKKKKKSKRKKLIYSPVSKIIFINETIGSYVIVPPCQHLIMNLCIY